MAKNKINTDDPPLRILVCGSRNWKDKKVIERELKKRFRYKNKEKKMVTVIHGGAKGADSYAGIIAIKANIPVEEYPADWERDGRSAGFLRNQKMLDEGKPNLVLAFTTNIHMSKGTKDMIERAEWAQIPVIIFDKEGRQS